MPPRINDLPSSVLFAILTEYPCADLVHHLSVCARVHPTWQRIAAVNPAYGGWWTTPADRLRTLRALSKHLQKLLGRSEWPTRAPRTSLDLGHEYTVGAGAGGKALIASLLVLPAGALVSLSLENTSLSAPALVGDDNTASLVGSAFTQRRILGGAGLVSLSLTGNSLGDGGIVALATCLSPKLEELRIMSTGCGDAGMVAIAEALPATCITELFCGTNPAVGKPGWEALGKALPRLGALKILDCEHCGGMGDDGIVALATGLPGAAAIEDLRLMYCNCADAGANALASAICSCPRLGKLNLSNLSQRVLDPKGPSALKLTAAVAQHRIAFPEALTKLTLTLL